jgi:hypothetical protein
LQRPLLLFEAGLLLRTNAVTIKFSYVPFKHSSALNMPSCIDFYTPTYTLLPCFVWAHSYGNIFSMVCSAAA